MRRVMLLIVSVLTILTMALSPALAHDRGDGDNDHDGWSEEFGVWVVFVPVVIFVDADFDGIEDSDDCGWRHCSALTWGEWDDCEWDDGEWDDCPWAD
jgi:hypothetical protein